MGEATSLPLAASLERKEAALDLALRELPSLIVAYSGGVDSAYLAYAAHRALGSSVLCVTADSPSYPERHRQIARRVPNSVHKSQSRATVVPLAVRED